MCEACGKEIEVMAFKGTSYCSDNCRRIVGVIIRDSHKA